MEQMESLYRINSITGEFYDSEIENRFSEISWPGLSKRLIIAFILCALNFLIANNVAGPDEFPEYRTVIIPMTKYFAIFLIAMALMVRMAGKYRLWLQILVSFSEIFIGVEQAANHYFFLIHINKFYDIGTSFIVFYILIFYLVVPNRLIIVVITNIIISVSFVYITNLSGLTGFSDIFSISMYLTIANALGYGIALTNNISKRKEFAKKVQLKQAQDEALEAKQMAEEANAAKSRFLAMINHEMRTPLNIVVGGIQIMENSPLNQEQEETLSMVKNSSELLKNLIRNILDFTDIERHNLKIYSEQFSLSQLIFDLDRFYSRTASDKGLYFELIDNRNGLDSLIGDSIRLRQIITNLLNNAVKFTNEGTVSLRIEVIERKKDSAVIQFSIEDTGIGIPEESFSDIIRPFVQVEQSITRNFDGSGLGLSICHQLLSAMNSRLEISSTTDAGSSFSFILNFKIPDNQPEEYKVPVLKSFNILLIDDISANLKIVGGILKSLNQRVVCAKGAREGIEKNRNEFFDIVFIDYHMPDMDGIETFLEIRKERPEIRAFLMTADTREEVVQTGKEAGMSGFVQKPVEKTVLCDILSFKNTSETEQTPAVAENMLIDPDFLNELKLDLGSEVMKDVMDACKASLENYCVILESGDTADNSPEILHQLSGISGNYRLLKLWNTVEKYRQKQEGYDADSLSHLIRETIILLNDS